jgi:putative CocE/NonD family hydrolase
MRRSHLLALAAHLLSVTLCCAWEKQRVEIPMRDGIRLSANVFLPAAQGRYPVLLIRTPYGKGEQPLAGYNLFLESGYALVIQDVRGRFDSQGSFDPLHQETADGSDTLDWIARQPWSTGAIGMVGGSYLGIVQWRAAISGNPHLKVIAPAVAGIDEYRDRFYSTGGAFKLGHRMLWIAENICQARLNLPSFERLLRHLPLRSMDKAACGHSVPFFQQALDHPSYDHFWRAVSTRPHMPRIRTPAFIIAGWYDNFAESDLEAFQLLTAHGVPARLLVGPWTHALTGDPNISRFGRQAGIPLRRLQLEWFNRWLKNTTDANPQPPVRIFVMGDNRWRDEQEWPLRRTQVLAFYLSSQRAANSLAGDGELLPKPRRRTRQDSFVYDPQNPVPTLGGQVCCNPRLFPWGPADQTPVEKRPDVLVYTSPPLQERLEVTGIVRASLFVSTSAPDTDFTAKLVDVFPDGKAINLTDGILRLRYRHSLEHPEPAQPGKLYHIQIDLGPTSNAFLPGHRIRLEVSSSNFPRFDRNPNTGRWPAEETSLQTARQTVYHGRRYPSRLLLPVIPNPL